jgi:hypothetical protein
MANAPRSERDGGVVVLIWGNPEAVYFFARDWTGSITLNGLKKFTQFDSRVIRRFDRERRYRDPHTISSEIADSNVDRQSYVAFVINVVATLGLSIGLAWLLFSGRPRADDEGARS